MRGVIDFKVSADNPDRARQFYTGVFNWKARRCAAPHMYWLVTTGPCRHPGTKGAVEMREDPHDTSPNSIDVPSVDDISARVLEHGGKVIAPKMSVPGVGYVAYCRDTEGNTFSIMESNEAAS